MESDRGTKIRADGSVFCNGSRTAPCNLNTLLLSAQDLIMKNKMHMNGKLINW